MLHCDDINTSAKDGVYTPHGAQMLEGGAGSFIRGGGEGSYVAVVVLMFLVMVGLMVGVLGGWGRGR